MATFRNIVLAIALIFLPAHAFGQTLPDKPSGYVTDAAHVLSDSTISSLESELAALDASTTEQIAVVTVPDMGGDYIEHYAADLFQKWGIGRAKQDDGVLLLLSINDHKLRIEVGYGLEGALPDSTANSIIQDDMVPLLKSGDYDGAVQKGVDDIVAAIQGEYTAPSVDSASSIDPETILFLLFFAIPWLAAIFGSSKSWWLGGVVGGVAGVALSTFLGWWLLGGAILTINLIIFGLIFDYLASQNAGHVSRGGAAGPWWTGGGYSGGSSSSGGFGGFGGGSSGGGGASGGW